MLVNFSTLRAIAPELVRFVDIDPGCRRHHTGLVNGPSLRSEAREIARHSDHSARQTVECGAQRRDANTATNCRRA